MPFQPSEERPLLVPPRRGTTLIEVMFSIGVVLIGLVGLAAIIPVAGRQAEDSVALNTGSALSASAFNSLTSRQFDQRTQWTMLVDTSASATVSPAPVGAAAYCLDPLFLSEPKNLIPEGATPAGYYAQFAATGTNGYRRALFPFYKQTYNPLVDPASPVTGGNQWSTHPRMWRVSVDRPGVAGAQFLSAKEAESIVESGDEISQAMPEDDTLDTVAIGQQAHPSDSGYGKRTTSGKYTWFATFNRIPGTAAAEVSTVIVQSRDRSYYTPLNIDGPADTDEDNASSERLAFVESASGFNGGAGGTVTIVASDKTDPEITSNDWVMLSASIGGNPVYQWYRVTGSIGDPERIEGYPDPVTGGAARNVWRQQLMLDGPDFSFLVPPAGVTQLTVVEGVVSVSRHTIPFAP
jgi:hypothetical protein